MLDRADFFLASSSALFLASASSLIRLSSCSWNTSEWELLFDLWKRISATFFLTCSRILSSCSQHDFFLSRINNLRTATLSFWRGLSVMELCLGQFTPCRDLVQDEGSDKDQFRQSQVRINIPCLEGYGSPPWRQTPGEGPHWWALGGWAFVHVARPGWAWKRYIGPSSLWWSHHLQVRW